VAQERLSPRGVRPEAPTQSAARSRQRRHELGTPRPEARRAGGGRRHDLVRLRRFGGSRIDARNGRSTPFYVNGINPIAIAFGLGAAWVANHGDGTLSRISAGSGEETDRTDVAEAPSAVAVTAGNVWVADFASDSVVRLDVKPDGGVKPHSVIQVGDGPVAIAEGEGALWVANRDGTVSRIDPQSEDVKTIELGDVQPVDIAVGDGEVWVTVQAPER
jgi:peptide/nickel transport system substrate-binding protein